MLLVFHAVESDLKGHMSIVFLPVPLESAPVLPFFGRFEGWMLEFLRGNLQATAVSLLHWKSGLGTVDHFKTLVPGLYASSVHVWKGIPKVEEDQRSTVSLVSRSGVLQVSSFGIPSGSLLALWERELYWSINYNDVRDGVVDSPENLFEAAAAFGTCRSQPEKLEAVQSGRNIQFFVKEVRGVQTQVVRGGCHVALGLVAGVMGVDVYAKVGGRIVNHSLSLESLGITSSCTVSFFSRLRGGLVTTCLGSGRVQIASRSVAGQCEPNATGVVHLVMLTLPLGMTKKGKVLRAPWVVLLRKDLVLCRPLPAIGHMWCPRVEARPGRSGRSSSPYSSGCHQAN